MTYDEIIKEAVKQAREDARKNGLKIGEAVAHPSDPFIYQLLEINGNEAVVGLPKRQGLSGTIVERKVFPLDELFSYRVALERSMDIKFRSRSFPKSDHGTFVVDL